MLPDWEPSLFCGLVGLEFRGRRRARRSQAGPIAGPWTSYVFGNMPYKYLGQNPKKEGHPGSR